MLGLLLDWLLRTAERSLSSLTASPGSAALPRLAAQAGEMPPLHARRCTFDRQAGGGEPAECETQRFAIARLEVRFDQPELLPSLSPHLSPHVTLNSGPSSEA